MPTIQNVHYATIEQKAPTWLKQAPPSLHRQMRNWHLAPAWLTAAIRQQPDIAKAWADEHARHREHEVLVQKLFEHIPDLETYAAKALTDAIKQRFGLDLDVRDTHLIDARLIDNNASDARLAINQVTRPLLYCALHNFDKDSAQAHGMDAPQALLKRSVILDHRRFMGTIPLVNTVDIKAEDFADMCRTLDIGGKYHEMVHDVYYPAGMPAPSAFDTALAVYKTLGQAEVSAYRQSLHFARLKGDISEVFYTQALAAPLDQKQVDTRPVKFHLVKLWECELTGVVIITMNTPKRQTEALFIPEDSETPLKEFATRDALLAELRDRLIANIHYLDKHIPDSSKATLIGRLKDRLTPWVDGIRGLPERLPDPHASLYPVTQLFPEAFQGYMAFQKSQRHANDVLFHAIPTEIVDRRTAQAHRELIAGRVLTAANLAGFFVPGLGEVMLAFCILQLAHEVYEGVEAWENDEWDTARAYMVDVIENVAIMVALHQAAKILRKAKGNGDNPLKGPDTEEPGEDEPEVERIPVETPSFIEELEPVETPDGQTRLWKPDLTPYESQVALPDNLEPDETGLRHYQGKTWLALPEKQYIVEQVPGTNDYRLQHPENPRRFQPIVQHNGAGAWLQITDKPQSWSGMTLLRRIGHLNAHFDEPTLQRILTVSDTHEDVLRRALVEKQQLPALLQDTLQRFRLDQTFRQLPDAATRPTEFSRAYARLPVSQAPGAETLQRVYPQLPAAVTDELARFASTSELQMLAAGKVPLRLGEEIRIYQQQIRLARAYEGVYLDSVASWDSDRLIMHMLERLPGWPAETKLKLLQRMSWPVQEHGIGPFDARPFKTITHAEAGYIVRDESHPGARVISYPTLFAALYEALPDAMSQLGASDPQALQHLVQESPPLPRSDLRKVLGMQAVRPGYRSPMRLADGRVGYPLSSGGQAAQSISPHHLIEAAEATGIPAHTGRSPDQVLMSLARGGRTHLEILENLQVLLEQRNELQSRLADWSEAILPSTDQAANEYATLREAIMQHWYDTALYPDTPHTAELHVQRVPLADVPMNLPAYFYTRVRAISLTDLPSTALAGWAQNERLLQRLLRQMPHIESLTITRPYDPRATPSTFLFSIPSIAENLPALQRLALTNQNIALSESDLNVLSGLQRLRYLDLSGNRLSQTNSPSFHELSLDYLGLNRMQLTQWPIGIGSDALGRIGHLSLQDNNLRSLPAFLLNEAEPLPSSPLLELQGNAINETHLQRLLINERAEMANISVDVPAELTPRLQRIRNERQQMRDAIDGWALASSSGTPLTQSMMADRQRIATAITDFWHGHERGLEHLHLHLEGVAIENFPRRLPSFFGERVRAMTLTRLSGTASQLDDLLSRFPNITRLTIDAHEAPTPSLASALARLPQLNYLEFRNMGLAVDQTMLQAFSALENLTSLDLSGNREGAIIQVPARLSSNLQSISLTNMNLHAWPTWCDSLLPLELLDLSSNNITELPEHILSNLDNTMPVSSIALFDNPLPQHLVTRMRAFSESQNSHSFALDRNLMFVETSSDDSAHPHFPILGDDKPRLEDWMLGTQEQNEALQGCWEALEGSNLLRLAGRLYSAAPYVDPTTRASFCERVRMMLVVAASNESERTVMEGIASAALPDPITGAQTCHDGALQEFNNIELYLMSQRLLIDAGDTLQALRRRLLQLFRVEQLEKQASKRTEPGDLVSVRLAYRRELSAELDLPIADRMRFRGAAQLGPTELTDVLQEVQESERSDALIDYMLANTDWTTRLRNENPEPFLEIENRYREQVLELANSNYPLAQEVDLQQQLQHDRVQEEGELLRELTIAQVNNS